MTGRAQQPRDRGAVLPIVALTLVTLIAMAAMTIDLGRLMMKRRDLQAQRFEVLVLDRFVAEDQFGVELVLW